MTNPTNDYTVKLRFLGTAEFLICDITTADALATAKLVLEQRLADIPGVRLEAVTRAEVRKEPTDAI